MKENKENLTALVSVKAVRTDKKLTEEDEKQQNKKKHLSIIQ